MNRIGLSFLLTSENYGSLVDAAGGKLEPQTYIIVTCMSPRNDSASGELLTLTLNRPGMRACMNVNTEFIFRNWPPHYSRSMAIVGLYQTEFPLDWPPAILMFDATESLYTRKYCQW